MNHSKTALCLGIAAACLLTIAVTQCHADEVPGVTVGLHTVSHHFPSVAGQNNVNPGLYVRFGTSDKESPLRFLNGVTAGGYRNTLGRNSFYVGYTATIDPFALTVGAISGYQLRTTVTSVTETPCDDPNPALRGCKHIHTEYKWEGSSKGAIMPMIAPSVRLYEVFGLTPRVTVLPKLFHMRSTVVHLSLERKF